MGRAGARGWVHAAGGSGCVDGPRRCLPCFSEGRARALTQPHGTRTTRTHTHAHAQVSAALAEKLDITRFDEFKVQVRAILADIEDRLRDWSPMARGTKAPLDGSGAVGGSSCLCCDSRVRSVRDLQVRGCGVGGRGWGGKGPNAPEQPARGAGNGGGGAEGGTCACAWGVRGTGVRGLLGRVGRGGPAGSSECACTPLCVCHPPARPYTVRPALPRLPCTTVHGLPRHGPRVCARAAAGHRGPAAVHPQAPGGERPLLPAGPLPRRAPTHPRLPTPHPPHKRKRRFAPPSLTPLPLRARRPRRT